MVRKLCGVGLTFLAFLSMKAAGQCFPDHVASVTPGVNGGFGSAYLPGNVLGPPHGTSDPQSPNANEEDLYSLGTGGEIVLEFQQNRIVDGPGPDLVVFENPVQPFGHPEQSYVEAATVSVSLDGVTWKTFPYSIDSTAPEDLKLKSNYHGLAGVHPSLSSPENGLPPFDPATGGGDGFDLSDIGVSEARYVRINDTGTTSVGSNGIGITDYGNLLDPDPSQVGFSIKSGFDLDAISAIHSVPVNSGMEPGLWEQFEDRRWR